MSLQSCKNKYFLPSLRVCFSLQKQSEELSDACKRIFMWGVFSSHRVAIVTQFLGNCLLGRLILLTIALPDSSHCRNTKKKTGT